MDAPKNSLIPLGVYSTKARIQGEILLEEHGLTFYPKIGKHADEI